MDEASFWHALAGWSDGTVLTDREGIIVEWNQGAEGITGLARSEAVGRPLWDVQSQLTPEGSRTPAAYKQFKANLLELLATAKSPCLNRGLETEIQCMDGTRRIVQASFFFVPGESEYGIGAVLHDITDLRRAEVMLQESKRRMDDQERFINSIVDSIPSSLVVIDRSLRVVSVNRNFLEKARRDASSTIGRKIGEVFPSVLMEYTHLDQGVLRVFRAGEAMEGGKVSYRAPGLSARIYYYRLIPLMAEGAVRNVMLLMDDITDRELLGEEVRRVERHLASVVECANDLVVSLDPEGQVVTWNQAAERISGLHGDQVKGRSIPSLCASEQAPVMADMLQRLAHGEGVQNTEVNLLTGAGDEVPIAWSCSPMRGDAGDLTGIVAVGRDLTERRQLEAQLVHSAKMASLGVMAGGIAHELRNPLGIISAAAQLLLERPDDIRLWVEGAKKIHNATLRASLIIESLVKFARPQNEGMGELDMQAVLEETLSLMDNQMALQKVTLQRHFQADLPRVYGNASLLQQVSTNMILNACNAMPQGGTLTVSSRSIPRESHGSPPPSFTDLGPWVEIAFSDTGRGIFEQHLSKIFDPFFTTMPVGKGTGLGLSISYGIIQQHQGSIEVESEMGQGTTFTIRLPGIAGDGLGGEQGGQGTN